jgi:hypothetical protein
VSTLEQTIVVILLVTGALTYLGARVWRTVAAARARKAGGCGANCGCE